MEYYSHTIRITNFENIDIYRIKKIIESGYIYSRRKMKEALNISSKVFDEETSVFNGMDYISLCDMSKKHEIYSAYYMYAYRGLSFLINKNIDVIIPKRVNISTRDIAFFQKAHMYGNLKERYSDLYDEVQVKDEISLDYMEGLSISLKRMELYHERDYIVKYLNDLKEVLLEYKKNVPIINLDTKNSMIIEKGGIEEQQLFKNYYKK